ncbi:MAG: AEC family transporter [Myxococcota bacterium]
MTAQMMVSLLLKALGPVAFGIALGYLAGRMKLISEEGARNFSGYVVTFALPILLFVSAFNFTPAQLEDPPYILAIVFSLVGIFVLGGLIGHWVFKLPVAETGLFACNSGFPDMAFFGLPVLLAVVGAGALLPVIIGNLVTSIVMVPIIVFMLQQGSARASVLSMVLGTLKQPVVWAPVLGLVLVLAGIKLPLAATDSLQLIGGTAGGIALFTLGVILSRLPFQFNLSVLAVVVLKNIVMPLAALMLCRLLSVESSLAKGVVIIAACPSGTIGAMLSSKFSVGQRSIPAEILASNAIGIVSMAVWVAMVSVAF